MTLVSKGYVKLSNRKVLDLKALNTGGDLMRNKGKKINTNNNSTDLGEAPVPRGGTGSCEGTCWQTWSDQE